MNFLLQRSSEWLLFQKEEVKFIQPFSALDDPLVAIIDSEAAVHGVINLEGGVQYAAALIERRLRAQGATEEDVKVLIHEIIKTSGGYQALYTALPLREWSQLMAWVDEQAQLCILIPQIQLLKNKLKKAGEAIVLQGCKELIFIAKLRSRFIFASLQTFSQNQDDLEICAKSLFDLVKEELNKLSDSDKIKSVQWNVSYSENTEPNEEELFVKFASYSKLNCNLNEHHRYIKNHQVQAESSLANLISDFKISMSVNPIRDKILYFSGRMLPVVSWLVLIFSAWIITQSVIWIVHLKELNIKGEENKQKIISMQNQIEELKDKRKIPEGFTRQKDFIENANKIHDGFDLPVLMNTLKEACIAGARVLRVYGEINSKATKEKPQVNSVFVDASPPSDGSQQAMTRFVEVIRNANYEVSPVDTIVNSTSTTGLGSVFTYQLKSIHADTGQ